MRYCFYGLMLCLFLAMLPGARAAVAQERYQLTVINAKLLPTKVNGHPWDIGCLWTRKKLHRITESLLPKAVDIAFWKSALSASNINFSRKIPCLPDPYVVIKIGGKVVIRTRKQQNTIQPSWGVTKLVQIGPSSHLEIYVYDKDLSANDPIGVHTITSLPYHYLMLGGDMSLRFGRVYELKLLLRPVSQLTPARLIGAYQVDKHATFRAMKNSLQTMSMQKRQESMATIGQMKVSMVLSQNRRTTINIVTGGPGQTLKKIIKGRWKILRDHVILQNNPGRAGGVTRCRLLYGKLICKWWGHPLILVKR